MQVKCEYCGNLISDSAASCPHCGAPNANVKRTADATPKTIEELKQWYADRHLPPPETTRFFIGEDYPGPRAFGIFRQGSEVIVYKNKANGSRAVRYRGTDEAYAVNELYLKLKSEILNQKARQGRGGSGGRNAGDGSPGKKKRFDLGGCFCWSVGIIFAVSLLIMALSPSNRFALRNLIVLAIVVLAIFVLRRVFNRKLRKKGKKPEGFLRSGILLYVVCIAATSFILISVTPRPKPRYYRYNEATYSAFDGSYYLYVDDFYDYVPVPMEELPADLAQHGADYEFDAAHVAWVDDYEFTDSPYYEEHLASTYESSDNSSDDDSDWDWDSGDSWDSGGTDWDSDW